MYGSRTLSLLACASAAFALAGCSTPEKAAEAPAATAAAPAALTGQAQIDRGSCLERTVLCRHEA